MEAAQATKEKMSPPVFSLAASAAAAAPVDARMQFCTNEPTEAETRIRGFDSENTARLSPSAWLSSTWQPGWATASGESAVAQLVQRYYSSALGRFMTPDPSGRVLDGEPTSWNMYVTAGGDPINRGDPHGLYYVSEEGGDPDWDWWWDEFWWESIGVAGGGPSLPLIQPDPNWKTPGQVATNVARWDAAIAAALAAELQQKQSEQAFRYVAYLAVVGDCYRRQVTSGGSVVRERTYKAVDEFGQPYAGIQINEHVYVQSGSLRATSGEPWTTDSNGEFVDILTRGGSPDTVAFQQFTATNPGGLNAFTNRPVMVFDPKTANGPFFGTLGISYRQHSVIINGNDGKVNGQLNYCP